MTPFQKKTRCVSKRKEVRSFGGGESLNDEGASNSKASPWSRSVGGTAGSEGTAAGPGRQGKEKKERERGGRRKRIGDLSLLCGVRAALRRGRGSGIGNGNGQGPT
jgi:hypothetical protein